MNGKDAPLLPRAILEDLYAHAQAGYPEEVCGFVVGPLTSPTVKRCENRQNQLHADDPVTFPRDARTAYNLGAKDVLFLDRSLGGPQPVAIIYHSHVEVGSYFSEEDVRAATFDGEPLYPVDYLVIDVKKGGVHGSKLFRFVDGAFVEIASYP